MNNIEYFSTSLPQSHDVITRLLRVILLNLAFTASRVLTKCQWKEEMLCNREISLSSQTHDQDIEQLYRIWQHFVYSAKTNTTTSGKLGRAVGFSTRASWAGVGF